MTRHTTALVGILALALALGFGLVSVMRLEGLAVVALALLVQISAIVIVSLKSRHLAWRQLLVLAILDVGGAAVGLLSGQPIMRLSLQASIDRFDRMANRCRAVGTPYCVLNEDERRHANSVSLVRFAPYRTTAISPSDWYVFLVRSEDEAARQFLSQHRCVESLTNAWFLEHRC